jgi:hypothetical protein
MSSEFFIGFVAGLIFCIILYIILITLRIRKCDICNKITGHYSIMKDIIYCRNCWSKRHEQKTCNPEPMPVDEPDKKRPEPPSDGDEDGIQNKGF